MGQMTKIKIDNPTVDAVGKMNFSGNVIPNAWFQTLRDKAGHPYMNAIVILADIRYWYTPTEIRDEESGRTIGYKTKFKADALQRSRNKFAEQFGLSLKQVDAALDYLQDCGIIKKEIRNDVSASGRKLGNTMYILLNPDILYRYTFPEEFCFMEEEELPEMKETEARQPDISEKAGYSFAGGEGIPPQGDRVCLSRGIGYVPAGGEGIPLEGESYTYNNTYINTKNNTYHHLQEKQGKEDDIYVREVFDVLCCNIKGIRMTEESKNALADCMRKHMSIQQNILLMASRFSASTCLSKVSASRIKYLAAVLSTLEERQIDTVEKFIQFQKEYGKKGEYSMRMTYEHEYDFEELESKLLT